MVLNKDKIARDMARYEDYFENYDSDPLPPGVDPATWIDPKWGWFDKLCKRATPYHMPMVFVMTILTWAYFLPSFIRGMRFPEEMKSAESEESEVPDKPSVYIGE